MTGRAEWKDKVTVNVPAELPAPTTRGWRILLAILVEVTTVEVLDGDAPRDC
jgi:hypothetical protein